MKLDNLFIIHPSRGRPAQAFRAARQLIENRTSGLAFRYLFSLDRDDPSVNEYVEGVNALGFGYAIINDNRGAVEAVNRAAALLRDEDAIFNMADDFTSQPGWDAKFRDFIASITGPEYFLWLSDFPNAHLGTFQFISSALYRSLGWFFYPRYISMGADHDLMMTAKARGCLWTYDGPPHGFDHAHPAWGKGQWDSTYERENSAEATERGRLVFAERQANGFTH